MNDGKNRLSLEKRNKIEYAAWCEWRKWCSVLRVLDPQPEPDEVAAGKIDNLTEEKRKELFNAIAGKIRRKARGLLEKQFLPARTEDDEDQGGLRDFLSDFDAKLKSPKARTMQAAPGLSYKDFIFRMIEQHSKEPELKIINGLIFSVPKGYLTDVVKDYIHSHQTTLKGDKYTPIQSLDEPVGEDSTVTVLDQISYDSFQQPDELESERMELAQKIVTGLTFREKIMVLASCARISVDDDELNTLLEIKKEGCCRAQDAAFAKLRELGADELDLKLLQETVNQIFFQLSPEKSCIGFLERVEGKLEKTK